MEDHASPQDLNPLLATGTDAHFLIGTITGGSFERVRPESTDAVPKGCASPPAEEAKMLVVKGRSGIDLDRFE